MPARTNPKTDIKSITPFLGMMTDKGSSINRKPGHFDLLDNVFSNLDEIKKRKGYTKYVNTDTTGSLVYGLHNQISAEGLNFNQVKLVSGSSNLYFYDIATADWIQFTGHTFPTSDTDFVEMDGFDEWNGSTNISETVKAGASHTTTDVILGSATGPWPDNSLVGEVARFTHSASSVEYKEIIGNYNDGTDDHILFSDDDPLNGVPADSVAIKIREKGNMLYIGGGAEYGVIGTEEASGAISSGASPDGYRQLDGTSYAHDGFSGIESHGNRIFGWYDRTLRFSDLYNGHNFGINSYFQFSSNVRGAKAFNDNVIIIYESRRIWALIGVNPSSWELRLINDDIGCNYIKTVANYNSTSYAMQIFVASDGNVRAITSDNFKQISRETKMLSLTDQYIKDELSASLNFACAGVDEEGKYTVFQTDQTFYTLNVAASERTRFREMIWSTGYTANGFGVAKKMSGSLVLGSDSNGQLYKWNDGNDDDGTAISTTIRRRGINFDSLGDKTKFKRIDIAQGVKNDSTTITVKCEANNSGNAATIEHTLGTHDPSTGDKLHSYKIPNNPSNGEGTGHMIDYEITENSSVEVAPIEDITFRYRPGLLK